MRRVLVIDHFDSYTWNLVHLVAVVTGRLPDVRQQTGTDLARLEGYSHLVLSPGPGSPDEESTSGLRELLNRPGPPSVLGVCLGMQIIVQAFGGTVGRTSPAHGVVSELTHDGEGLFAGLPPRFRVVRYHSLAAIDVPRPLEVTARAEGVVMAVRDPCNKVVGVQFHPESVLAEFGEEIVRNFFDVAG